jgi:hypothetical protein
VGAWNELRERVMRMRVAVGEKRFKQGVRRRHDLEQRIRVLESRPASSGRDALPNGLRAELAAGG